QVLEHVEHHALADRMLHQHLERVIVVVGRQQADHPVRRLGRQLQRAKDLGEELQVAELLARLARVEASRFQGARRVQRSAAIDAGRLPKQRLREDEAQHRAVIWVIQVKSGAAEVIAGGELFSWLHGRLWGKGRVWNKGGRHRLLSARWSLPHSGGATRLPTFWLTRLAVSWLDRRRAGDGASCPMLVARRAR